MSSKLYFVLNCDKLQHCGDDNIIADKVHSLVLLVYRIKDYVYYVPANSPGFTGSLQVFHQISRPPPPPPSFLPPKVKTFMNKKR